jgi:hypothetical protein
LRAGGLRAILLSMRLARLAVPFLLLAGCAAEPEPPSLWLAERGLVWCYRTLADPDCYRRPLTGAEHRLIAAAPQVYFTPRDARFLPVPPID